MHKSKSRLEQILELEIASTLKYSNTSDISSPESLKPSTNYQDELQGALNFTLEWHTKTTGSWLNRAVNLFLGFITELYLNYFQYDLAEAQRIIKVSAVNVEKLTQDLRQYTNYGAKSFGYSHEWDEGFDLDEACLLKTNIEAFNVMFLENKEQEDNNELIKYIIELHQNSSHAINRRPKNVPKSHWWWFYENESYLQ